MDPRLLKAIEKEFNEIKEQTYSMEEIYENILSKKLYFNEIGGYYLPYNKFVNKKKHIQYDTIQNKPYYVFDMNEDYFKKNQVFWHIHPYQGDFVWNCYPSFADLDKMMQEPKKTFILITKCGSFLYMSKLDFPVNFRPVEYKEIMDNVFKDVTMLKNIKTQNYLIIYFPSSVPHEEILMLL